MASRRPLAPRVGRANYIVQRGGAFYYRRTVPRDLRDAFGKTELWVPLTGRTKIDRLREALAHAAQHDREFQEVVDLREGRVPVVTPVYRSHGWGARSDAPPPLVWRGGALQQFSQLVVTTDPAIRRAAEAEGAVVLTWDEDRLQQERRTQEAEANAATTPLERQRALRVVRGIEAEIAATTAAAPSDSISRVMESWFAHRRQAAETQRKHRQHIKEFVSFAGGDLPISQVSTRMVSDYLAAVATQRDERGRTLSPGSAAKRLDTIKALFRYAKRHGRVVANPAQDVDAPRDERAPSARSYMPLTTADSVTLLAMSTDLWDKRRQVGHPGRAVDLKVALRLIMATGARPNEICQLRRADVDIQRRCISITDDGPIDEFAPRRIKNSWSARVVPLHPAVWPIVFEHVRRSDHVLLFESFAPGRAHGYFSDVISGEWTDNLRRVVRFDHPKKVLDSLRHTFAVEADRVGMPEAIKHELMGHSRGKNRNATRYVINADSVDSQRYSVFRSWIEKMRFPALEAEAVQRGHVAAASGNDDQQHGPP